METSPQLSLKSIAWELGTLSWTLILGGLISIAVGILAFVAPLPTLAALVLLFGVYATDRHDEGRGGTGAATGPGAART
jgi:uncharacterized membrane protein HdeD (DUF308 family)